MLKIKSTDEIISYSDFKKLYPSTCFPTEQGFINSQKLLDHYGVEIYIQPSQPYSPIQNYVPPPITCTIKQLKFYFLNNNQLDEIDNFISNSTSANQEIWNNETQNIENTSTFIQNIQTFLSLTDSEIKTLFSNALSLTIPQIISMRQCHLYLYDINELSNVQSIIGTLSDKAKIEWNTSSEVWRSSPTVELLRNIFDWTNLDMDKMFYEAYKL